jgi:hypothetical protein
MMWHQALVMSQDTRVRQNEFFASKNYACPPPGPELNPVPYVNYVMPPIDDEMFYGYPMPSSQGRSRPSRTRILDEDELHEDEDEGEDEGEEEDVEDAESPPHPFAFHLPLYLAPSFLVFRCQGREVSRVLCVICISHRYLVLF